MGYSTINLVLIFLVVLTIVFIAIFVYRAVYKRNVNRALDGIHATRLIDPLSFVQLIIMVVTMILGIVTISKVNVLQSEVSDLSAQLNSAETNINWIRSDIASLNAQISNYYSLQRWVQASTYHLNDYDQITQTIETMISFSLKEVDLSSQIYVVATNVEDATDFIKLPVNSVTLDFEVALDLNKDKNYQISVISETLTTSTGEAIFNINLKNIFSPGVSFSVGLSGQTNQQFDVKGHFDNQGIDNWTMTSFEIRYYDASGNFLSNVDLLPYITPSMDESMWYFSYESTLTNSVIHSCTIKSTDSFGRVWESEPIAIR